ncbi:MAG: hypothetical protein ACRDIB_05090, partial [Ardenticatenaceae bacterium]
VQAQEPQLEREGSAPSGPDACPPEFLFNCAIAGNASYGLRVNNSSAAANATAITGQLTNATPGSSSAALRGRIYGTGANGIGVWGSHGGSGWGVYGYAPSGRGVYGYAPSGQGVYGASDSATGVWGVSTDGLGMYAISTNAPGLQADSLNSQGIYGSSSNHNGIEGVSFAAEQSGVHGENLRGGFGVTGRTESGRDGPAAVLGENTGEGSGVIGISSRGWGVQGISNGGGRAGVRGEGFIGVDGFPSILVALAPTSGDKAMASLQKAPVLRATSRVMWR